MQLFLFERGRLNLLESTSPQKLSTFNNYLLETALTQKPKLEKWNLFLCTNLYVLQIIRLINIQEKVDDAGLLVAYLIRQNHPK